MKNAQKLRAQIKSKSIPAPKAKEPRNAELKEEAAILRREIENKKKATDAKTAETPAAKDDKSKAVRMMKKVRRVAKKMRFANKKKGITRFE